MYGIIAAVGEGGGGGFRDINLSPHEVNRSAFKEARRPISGL